MKERTLAIIKPHAVKAKHSGNVISRIEQEGISIVRLEKIFVSKEKANRLYAIHKGKPFFDELIEMITEGPSVVMVLEGENIIERWRKLMGATNPADAQAGTLRKLYGESHTKNAFHGADSQESAVREIKIFFPTA